MHFLLAKRMPCTADGGNESLLVAGSVWQGLPRPVSIDAAPAKAKYDSGVLTLTLPKKIGQTSKRLAVE